ITVRPHGDFVRIAAGNRKLRDRSGGRDSPDLVHGLLCEPEIAVRPCRDPKRLATASGDRKLRNRSGGGDSPDLVPKPLCEPEIAVRPCRDPKRIAASGDR